MSQPEKNKEGEKQSLDRPQKHRLEGLSDAAFSIIITLPVLEIHRPSTAQGMLASRAAGGIVFLFGLHCRLHPCRVI